MTNGSDTSRNLDRLARDDVRAGRAPAGVPRVVRLGIRAFGSLATAYGSITLSTALSEFAVVGGHLTSPHVGTAAGTRVVLSSMLAFVIGPIVYAWQTLAVTIGVFAVSSVPKLRSIGAFLSIALATLVGSVVFGYTHPSDFLTHIPRLW